MKTVTIFLTNDKLSVNDQDNSDITNYTKNLSNLLYNNNVTVLHTSESSLIVRPSKIQAILVTEDNQTNKIEVRNENETEEQEPEDIISD